MSSQEGMRALTCGYPPLAHVERGERGWLTGIAEVHVYIKFGTGISARSQGRGLQNGPAGQADLADFIARSRKPDLVTMLRSNR